MESLSWDEDVGDVTSFVLIEMTPLLQTYGLLDNTQPFVVVHGNHDSFAQEMVSVLQTKMKMTKARSYQMEDLGAWIIGLYQVVHTKFSQESILPFRSYRRFPSLHWTFLGVMLLVATMMNTVYLVGMEYVQSRKLGKLESALSSY